MKIKNSILVTNRRIAESAFEGSCKVALNCNYSIYYSGFKSCNLDGNHLILLDGYFLLRDGNNPPNEILKQEDLIKSLYNSYGSDFITKIKGIFCIIIIKGSDLEIFTDHFGIYKLYYTERPNEIAIANTVNLIKDTGLKLVHDKVSLAIKSILHHTAGGCSLYKDISYTQPATKLAFKAGVLKITNYWDYKELYTADSDSSTIDYQQFADLFLRNFQQYNEFLNPEIHAISLTGGKDSRTGLSALLHHNITPVGFTYGNPQSRDAVYASILAQKLKLDHHIIFPKQSPDWFDNCAKEIIQTGIPEINIHRSHRNYAFKLINEQNGSNLAYYGGYLGGEFLMGLYYDNLQFTNYLTEYWNTNTYDNIQTHARLNQYFHLSEGIHLDDIYERLSQLETFNPTSSLLEKQFHAIFEIAISHHSQDLQLARMYFDYPIPFFIDVDFLELLFQSKYSFKYRNNRSKNLLTRHQLYLLNLSIQHILFPPLDTIPFGKRGSYTTNEFLKGRYYWSVIKAIRYAKERKDYPPSFKYTNHYKGFLQNSINTIKSDRSSEIHNIYDIDRASTELKNSSNLNQENMLHGFSNIVMHYMQEKHFK